MDALNSQAKEAYQDQLDYYRTLKDAAEDLRNVARGFADDARSASDTLQAAQIDYNQTLRAAKAGDVVAAGKLGEAANRLKPHWARATVTTIGQALQSNRSRSSYA